MDGMTLKAIKGNRANMGPGLVDNLTKHRRELHLIWEGKPLFYGWCMASSLAGAGQLWKPDIPFGSLA